MAKRLLKKYKYGVLKKSDDEIRGRYVAYEKLDVFVQQVEDLLKGKDEIILELKREARKSNRK